MRQSIVKTQDRLADNGERCEPIDFRYT